MMNVTAAELGPERDKSANSKGTLAIPGQTARRAGAPRQACSDQPLPAANLGSSFFGGGSVGRARPSTGLGSTSLLYVSHQLARIDFRAVDIPVDIGGHPFRGAAGSRSSALLHRLLIRDQGGDPAVLRTADPQTTPEARILRCVGFGIGDIDGVARVDIDAARPAELLPFGKEFPILVEDLDAIVSRFQVRPKIRRRGRARRVSS